VTVDDDLRVWLAAQHGTVPRDYPPLVWTAAPDVVTGAQLDAGATRLATQSGDLAFRLTPKIPLNRSYFDTSPASYFSTRRVKVRGTIVDDGIIAPRGPRISGSKVFHLHAYFRPTFPPLSRFANAPVPTRRVVCGLLTPPKRCGNEPVQGAICAGAQSSGSCSMARRVTTTRRTRVISRWSPAACRTMARSATGWSTISTRSTRRAKKES
jgi:hypothetical protein